MQSRSRGLTTVVARCQKGDVLSYQSRAKKRKYKRVERKSKQLRTPETAGRWFLTVAKKPGRYMCCGEKFHRGGEIVYRHEPRAIRCVRCAERDPESQKFRTSLRWDRANEWGQRQRVRSAPRITRTHTSIVGRTRLGWVLGGGLVS